MVLATHAVVGASAILIFKEQPGLGLLAAFVSHFILDTIPHWHYPLKFIEADRSLPVGEKMYFDSRFSIDLIKIFLDFSVGLGLAVFLGWAISPALWFLAGMGAIAGTLADFLTFTYHVFPKFPLLENFRRLHKRVHASVRLDKYHVVGVLQEVFTILIAFQVAVLFA